MGILIRPASFVLRPATFVLGSVLWFGLSRVLKDGLCMSEAQYADMVEAVEEVARLYLAE